MQRVFHDQTGVHLFQVGDFISLDLELLEHVVHRLFHVDPLFTVLLENGEFTLVL